MDRALKTLRAVQWTLLGSVVLYVGLGEIIRPVARGINPTISYLFTTLAVAVIGAIFVVRRTLVFPAAASLTSQPGDILSLRHWITGFVATYALCEALGLFGLVQRFLGGTLQQSAPYFLGAFVLLIFFQPRQPIAV
jgi:hypothetical protein